MSALVSILRPDVIVIAADKRLGISSSFQGEIVDPVSFVDGTSKLRILRDDLVLGMGTGEGFSFHESIAHNKDLLSYMAGEDFVRAAEGLHVWLEHLGAEKAHGYLWGFDNGEPKLAYVNKDAVQVHTKQNTPLAAGIGELTSPLFSPWLEVHQRTDENGVSRNVAIPQPPNQIRTDMMSLAKVVDLVVWLLRTGGRFLEFLYDVENDKPAMRRVGQTADVILMKHIEGETVTSVYHIGEALGLDFQMAKLVYDIQ